MTREQLLRQIESAHRQVRELAKLYPACFDKQGRPIVAVARLPLLADGVLAATPSHTGNINPEPTYPKPPAPPASPWGVPEAAWLIEQDNHFPRHRWLRVVVESSNGVPRARIDWTERADIALRFARKEDARAFAALHHEHCTLALLTEHYWISVPSPTEPAMPARSSPSTSGCG